MSTRKPFEELELSDDFMFGIIMRNPENCKGLLERILGISITKLEYPEEQKTIDLAYDAKSIRLDVLVSDDQGTAYTIEMQKTSDKNLPKRSRYYSALMALNLIDKGMDYDDLPKNIVIFICTFDLFGDGEYIYWFENRHKRKKERLLDDGTVKIFINTKGTEGEVSDELKALINYIDCGVVTDSFTEKLEEEVASARNNTKWRHAYMTLDMKLKEERKEAMKEGIAIGEERGIEIGKLQTLFEMYDENDVSLQKVIEKSGLSEENFNTKFEQWKANR